MTSPYIFYTLNQVQAQHYRDWSACLTLEDTLYKTMISTALSVAYLANVLWALIEGFALWASFTVVLGYEALFLAINDPYPFGTSERYRETAFDAGCIYFLAHIAAVYSWFARMTPAFSSRDNTEQYMTQLVHKIEDLSNQVADCLGV